MTPAEQMRMMLAQNAGIFFDDPAAPSPTAMSSPPTSPDPADREIVREILVARGAPAEALEWLVESCPSVEVAREFVPTSWMRRAIDDDPMNVAFNPEEP